jgi:predicted transcriptional regulator of viral defense system
MGTKKSDARSSRAWALAGKQHGIVTRRDLLSLGYSPQAIKHRIAKGRLHPVAQGVYAVGWPKLTRERRWMAAVLACGRGAALSHRSAGALWGIVEEMRDVVDVSIPRRCESKRPGVHARSRPSLPADDITNRRGIPLTVPARTLVDLATELAPTTLERAVNEADKHDLIRPDQLRKALDQMRGERGVAQLRALLDRHTFRLSDSPLELLFRPIAAEAGLPPPQTKVMVNGFEVDFFWPELDLVVETDGLRYHRTTSTQARDQLRDQTHTAAGLTALRFTHRQVKYEREHVCRVLRSTREQLEDRARTRQEGAAADF